MEDTSKEPSQPSEAEQKTQQEMMFKLQMFEQQIQQLQQQQQAIEQGIMEMTTLDTALEDIKGSAGKEIMAPIGRGIFVKGKIETDELTVDVGGKNFVTKSILDTKEIIKSQITKLEEVRTEIQENMNQLNNELVSMLGQE